LEIDNLQIDYDIAVEPGVIKEHVEEKFIVVHLQPVLVADKSETGAHLNEEVPEPIEQSFFEGAFRC
jgi:hypothetical protein